MCTTEPTATEETTSRNAGKLTDTHPTNFEEAITITGIGRFHYLLLFVCGCCLTAMITEVIASSFLLPAAQCEFGMNEAEKGLLNSICYAGMIASSHLWGFLADTEGRRKVLIIALFLDALCCFASSIAPSYWLFVLLRFFNGFFICAPSSVVYAYLGEFHGIRTRTRAIMFMSIAISLGAMLQQGMAWMVIPLDLSLPLPWLPNTFTSWRLFVTLSGLPSLVAALMLYFTVPESPKFLLSAGRHDEALDVLRQVFASNTRLEQSVYPVKNVVLGDMNIEDPAPVSGSLKTPLQVARYMWAQTWPLFKMPHLPLTALAFFMQFSFYASFNGLAMWMPDLYNRLADYSAQNPDHDLTVCEVVNAMKVDFVEGWNFTTDDIGAYNQTTECIGSVNPTALRNTMLLGAICTVIYTFYGYLVSYFAKKPLIAGSLLAATGTSIGLFLVRSEIGVITLTSLFIATTGVCVNLLNSIVIESIPTQLRAMAVCLSLMSGRCGVTVCALLLGVFLDFNCTAVFLMFSGIVFVCCLLTYFLPSPPTVTKPE